MVTRAVATESTIDAHQSSLAESLPRSTGCLAEIATAMAITTTYGAARALAVVAAIESVPGDDYGAACDYILNRFVS